MSKILGSDYQVFGITHPYSGFHSTEGYTPCGPITENRDEAIEEAKSRWAANAHPITVVLASVRDKDMIKRRNEWAEEWDVDFWGRIKK